jgi:hypothetical protein
VEKDIIRIAYIEYLNECLQKYQEDKRLNPNDDTSEFNYIEFDIFSKSLKLINSYKNIAINKLRIAKIKKIWKK